LLVIFLRLLQINRFDSLSGQNSMRLHDLLKKDDFLPAGQSSKQNYKWNIKKLNQSWKISHTLKNVSGTHESMRVD